MPRTIERYISGSDPITVEVFSPRGHGRHPGCLVLHGSFGLLPDYRAEVVSFGEALAEAGVVAVLPYYFERTGTAPGAGAMRSFAHDLPDWLAACGDGLLFARNDSRIDAGRLGAIGFSLGGHLALSLAMALPPGTMLKYVVEFFAPTLVPRLVGNRASLPPVQIHHGTADQLVLIRDSETLVNELRAAGKVEGLGYEFIKYIGQGHRFTPPALDSSRSTTVAFIQQAV
jgi:dienelactone hydrolase